MKLGRRLKAFHDSIYMRDYIYIVDFYFLFTGKKENFSP